MKESGPSVLGYLPLRVPGEIALDTSAVAGILFTTVAETTSLVLATATVPKLAMERQTRGPSDTEMVTVSLIGPDEKNGSMAQGLVAGVFFELGLKGCL